MVNGRRTKVRILTAKILGAAVMTNKGTVHQVDWDDVHVRVAELDVEWPCEARHGKGDQIELTPAGAIAVAAAERMAFAC